MQQIDEDVVEFQDWMVNDDFPDGVRTVIRRKVDWSDQALLAEQYPELMLAEESKYYDNKDKDKDKDKDKKNEKSMEIEGETKGGNADTAAADSSMG